MVNLSYSFGMELGLPNLSNQNREL
jgi:hypothetical protein